MNNEKSISAKGVLFRKLIAPLGPILVWLFYEWEIINTPFFVFAFVLTFAIMLLYLKLVKTKFTEQYIRFGKDKVDYSEIIDLSTLSFNFYTFLIFKTKHKSIWKKYYITELDFIGIIEIIKLIFGKKEKLNIEFFHELLFQKSAIPKKRWKKILGDKEFKKALKNYQ